MSVVFDIFWLVLSFAIPTEVELSVDIGVGSFWVHPISFNIVCSNSYYFMLVNRDSSSTSADDDTVCLRIPAIERSTLLLMLQFFEYG